jgi:soluble lytic murein transglycosylase-like protein
LLYFRIIIFILFIFLVSSSKYEKSYPPKKDFYKNIIGNSEIIDAVFYYSKTNHEIILGIIYAESRFKKNVISRNRSGGGYSLGLMQINEKFHKHLKRKQILSITTNISLGINIFNRCLELSDNDTKLALCYYNAGYRRIKKYGIPESSKKYAMQVINYSYFLRNRYYEN